MLSGATVIPPPLPAHTVIRANAGISQPAHIHHPAWTTPSGGLGFRLVTDDITVFSGSAHPAFAEEVCELLQIELSPSQTSRFSNDCLQVHLEDNCRKRDVFIVQPLVPPVQENLVELLLMLDAARGASAGHLTVVMPHYAYARSDKKDAPRISIGARLVADLLHKAGASAW